MAPITREQALENALASSRIEGYEVSEQTRAAGRSEGKMLWQTMQWILCRMGAIRVLWC